MVSLQEMFVNYYIKFMVMILNMLDLIFLKKVIKINLK